MILTPFADLTECVECFDPVTLIKQCISVYRLLERFQQHDPRSNTARRFLTLWKPYPQALIHYGELLALRCKQIGRTHVFDIFTRKFRVNEVIKFPKWLGWEKLHKSHRGRLVFLEEKRIVKEGCNRYFPEKNLNQWSMSYSGDTFNHADVYTIHEMKDWLLVNCNAKLQTNFYTQQGFIDKPSNCFVWPFAEVASDFFVTSNNLPCPPPNFTRLS